MQPLEPETEDRPERQVVEANEPTPETDAALAVVPGSRAEQSAKDAAGRVLDAQDPRAVGRGPDDDRPAAQPVVQRLEERQRQAVHEDVQRMTRPPPPRVQPDEERVHSPASEAVDEKTLRRAGRRARLGYAIQGPTPPMRSTEIRSTWPGGGLSIGGNFTSGPR